MAKLEGLRPNAAVRGILPDGLVTVVSVQWFGSDARELTYKTPAGKVAALRTPGARGARASRDTSTSSVPAVPR
jgi:hypothetical protein